MLMKTTFIFHPGHMAIVLFSDTGASAVGLI